jgi:protein Mpv17
MITLPPSASFDKVRTFRMAAYGLLILGPSQHLWFNFLSKILPERDLLTTLKKIFMGQAIYGPSIATVFFSYNAGLQGKQNFCIE